MCRVISFGDRKSCDNDVPLEPVSTGLKPVLRKGAGVTARAGISCGFEAMLARFGLLRGEMGIDADDAGSPQRAFGSGDAVPFLFQRADSGVV